MRRVALAVLTASVALGCDRRAKDEAPPAPAPAEATELLGIDAGIGFDPPAPAGDLAQDVARFTDLESCVKQRSQLDPLAFDALRAIGYDTFVRDACRMLEAAHDRKRAPCERIDASGLRTTCLAWVAQLSETPDACPLAFEGLPARGRAPTCVALAAKDPRLCAAEARASARVTCEAIATREPTRCDVLLPAERASCQRELARWRAALPAPLSGLPALPAASGTLSLEAEPGSPATPEATVDLAPELRRGLVVVTGRGHTRVEVGTLGESELARIPGAPTKRTRLGLAIDVDAKGAATLERLELEVAGEAPMVLPTAKCACKVTSTMPTKRGEPATLSLEGTVSGAARSYRIKMDARTFVRDVVTDDRAFAPAHPVLKR